MEESILKAAPSPTDTTPPRLHIGTKYRHRRKILRPKTQLWIPLLIINNEKSLGMYRVFYASDEINESLH